MALRYPAPRAEEFLARLRERLPEKTFRHVCGVADLMVQVAEPAGISYEQAVAAGLLHDYCKAMQPEALLAAVNELKVDVPDGWLGSPKLLHGPVGAAMVQRDLGIADSEVYDAIYWHTTGRPEWGAVGLALYFSDYSEVGRNRPESARAREILESDGYEKALEYAVRSKTGYVLNTPAPDPATAAFADWFFSTYSD